MPFSLQIWRQQFSDTLSELAFWLDQRRQRRLPPPKPYASPFRAGPDSSGLRPFVLSST